MSRPAPADLRRFACLAAPLLVAACGTDAAVAPIAAVEDAAAASAAAPLADVAGRIVYAANVRYTPAGGTQATRAMSVRPDGGDPRPLLPGGRGPWRWVVDLQLSPARDRVLFHGDGAVQVLHRDGSIVEVGHDSLNVDELRWSPDGRWIVGTQFWPPAGDRKGTVWLMPADGSGATRFPIGTTDRAIFTPDGLVAVQGDPGRGEAWEHATLDGVVVRRVGALEQIALRKRIEDTSPDGRWRAAVSPRSGIWLTNVATGDSSLVLARPGISYRVRWSPDGRHLAALADCGPSRLEPGEVLVVAADGSGARTVARDVFCRAEIDW